MHQPVTTLELKRASELARPLEKHVVDGTKLDASFLIEVAQDFPVLFGDTYKSKFGSR